MRKLLAGIAGLLCSMSAQAELVTFDYNGMVNFITERPVNFWDGHARALGASTIAPATIRVGHTFSGRLVYDTETPRWFMGDPLLEGYYSQAGSAGPGPASSIRFDQAGWQLDTRPQSLSAQVVDYMGDVVSLSQALQGNGNLWFHLSGDADAISGVRLPTDIDLARFDSPFLTLTWINAAGTTSLETRGMLTSLTRVAAVPEPASFALLLGGLAIVAGAARRRTAGK